MVEKNGARQKTSAKSVKSGSLLSNPSTWVIGFLAVTLLAVCGVSAYGFQSMGSRNDIDARKVVVFDDVMSSYFNEVELNVDGKTEQKTITGYGISDEDGVFYVTFDLVTYDDESPSNLTNKRYGVMYFWLDNERGTYSHAFSYHDEAYHPDGVYVKL